MCCRLCLDACVAAVLLLAVTASAAGADPQTSASDARRLFIMNDPLGDDDGAGHLTYPLAGAFSPHRDLFDLRSFAVFLDEEFLRFDLILGALANPWNAPEGFYHPRIDVYIHTGEREGKDVPLRPGPGVRFDSKWPWQLWLRIAPFGETGLFGWEDDPESPGRRRGVQVEAIHEKRLIRVSLPLSLLPTPGPDWRFYVLVGSFDGFGVDGYRRVGDVPSRWLLGGAAEADARVMDLLAPTWGPRTQHAQLSRSDGVPTVYPVGGFDLYRFPLGWYLVTLIVITALIGRPRFPGIRLSRIRDLPRWKSRRSR